MNDIGIKRDTTITKRVEQICGYRDNIHDTPKKKNVFFILTLHKVNPFYENKYYQELL